jgi:hypothetical protein
MKKYGLLIVAIKNILSQKGYLIEEKINSETTYDYIIIFDQKSFNQIKKTFQNKSKIIYVTYISDVVNEYLLNEVCIYRSFIFLDKKCNLNLQKTSTNIFINMFSPPFSSDNITDSTGGDKPTIYIDIDNDLLNSDICFKILPVMNTLVDYQIYLYTNNRAIASLINKHIKIVKDKDDIASYINKSDIVIGSGYSALLACKLKKKVIVVGERGYGGLVTETNIQAFYLNLFQGRNGGKLDEYISHNLLVYDIENEIDEKSKQQISDKLEQLEQKNLNVFVSIFENCILDTEDILDKKYTINPCYTLDKVGRYFYVIDTNTYKRIKRINESECLIMLEFQNSNNISTLFEEYEIEYKDDILKLVQKFIENKYLLPCIESDFIAQEHSLIIE